MQGQTSVHTSINIRMYAPRAVLALCLSCFLSGNVFGYEYGADYSDSYYNEISNGERLQSKSFSVLDVSSFFVIHVAVLTFCFSFDFFFKSRLHDKLYIYIYI